MHCTTRPRRKWSAFLFSACAVYIYVFIFLGAIITPLATTTTVTTCSEMQLVPIPSPYIVRVYGWGRILFPIPFACHEFHDAPARRGGKARHTVWRRSTEFVYVVIYCEQPTHPLLWRSSFARGQLSSNFFFLLHSPAHRCRTRISRIHAQFVLSACVGHIFRKSIYIRTRPIITIIIFVL